MLGGTGDAQSLFLLGGVDLFRRADVELALLDDGLLVGIETGFVHVDKAGVMGTEKLPRLVMRNATGTILGQAVTFVDGSVGRRIADGGQQLFRRAELQKRLVEAVLHRLAIGIFRKVVFKKMALSRQDEIQVASFANGLKMRGDRLAALNQPLCRWCQVTFRDQRLFLKEEPSKPSYGLVICHHYSPFRG